MSDSLVLSRQQGISSVEPVSAGVHSAICNAVIDLGKQQKQEAFRHGDARDWVREVLINWEVDETYETQDGKIMPRQLSQRFTFSFNERSRLFKTLESWRGKAFLPEELEAFDLKGVLDKPCLLNIQNIEKNNGKKYANIVGVTPLMKGMTPLKRILPTTFFVLNKESLDKLESLPDYWKTPIKKSSTYAELTGQPSPTNTTANTAPSGHKVDVLESADNDDLPF